MKRMVVLLLLCGCAEHLTQTRRWNGCRAQVPAIVCSGSEVARVECVNPAGDGCGQLFVRYSGGERVLIAPQGALRPEITADGSQIWFKSRDERADMWRVYDPQLGVTQQVDGYQLVVRRGEQETFPLWMGGAK